MVIIVIIAITVAIQQINRSKSNILAQSNILTHTTFVYESYSTPTPVSLEFLYIIFIDVFFFFDVFLFFLDWYSHFCNFNIAFSCMENLSLIHRYNSYSSFSRGIMTCRVFSKTDCFFLFAYFVPRDSETSTNMSEVYKPV